MGLDERTNQAESKFWETKNNAEILAVFQCWKGRDLTELRACQGGWPWQTLLVL